MSYYDQRDYRSDSRRNSLSEDQSGVKRKKPRWTSKRRGGSIGANRSSIIDTPLFKEPTAPPTRSPVGASRFNRSGQRDNPFRTGASFGANVQPYFDIRDMPDFVEPQHSGPSWHWDTYFYKCKSWQDKHKLAYYRSRCTALEFENQMLFEQINSLIDENCVFAAERGVTPTVRLPDIFSKQGRQSEQDAQGSNAQTTLKKQGKNSKLSTTSDSELEFGVNEDVMAFLEKSIRYKLSLKKKRNEEAAKAKGEDGKTKEGTKQTGPKLPMGLKRKEELDQLYGKNATLIQGLETSVQLNYNRICDTYKPEMWMAVALNPQTVTA